MSISIGIGDLALFLADEDDPEEIEEYLETYRQLSRFLAAHEDAEFGGDFLLTKAEPQCAAAALRRPGSIWTGLNDRVLSRGRRRHGSC